MDFFQLLVATVVRRRPLRGNPVVLDAHRMGPRGEVHAQVTAEHGDVGFVEEARFLETDPGFLFGSDR